MLPYVFQDLTRVSTSLASEWVTLFLSRAKREDPWEESRVRVFALNLRNQIQALTDFLVPPFWNAAR